MSSGGKGGGAASQSYDYFGTIAGVLGYDVDYVKEVIVDGKSAWTGTASRSGASSTITVPDFGELIIYWGDPANPTLPAVLTAAGNDLGEEHPSYFGWTIVVLDDFLFGRERQQAPNIEIIAGRRPKQAVVSAASVATLQDGQANPVAAVLELLTDEQVGLGLPAALLDADACADAASLVHAAGRHASTFCSMLLTAQAEARKAVADLSLIADLGLYVEDGQLAVVANPKDADLIVSELPLLTAADLLEPVSLTVESWSKVANRFVIEFTDRDRAFKATSETFVNQRGVVMVGEVRTESFRREAITRRSQARTYLQEWAKQFGRPSVEGEIVVRTTKAASLRPGSHVLIDIEPEPGGLELRQVCKVVSTAATEAGGVRLGVVAVRTIAPLVYQGATVADLEPQLSSPSNPAEVELIELPPPLVDFKPLRLAALSSRPDQRTTGFDLYYDRADDGPFALIGSFSGFALKGTLEADFSDLADIEADAVTVSFPSPQNPEFLAADFSDQTAANDETILILSALGADGLPLEDAQGRHRVEFFAVRSLTPGTGSEYDLTVFRGRFGTTVRDWDVSDVGVTTFRAWLMPKANLRPIYHADFGAAAAALTPVYFRSVGTNAFAAADTGTAAAGSFEFPTVSQFAPRVEWTTPSVAFAEVTTNPHSLVVEANVVDQDRNLTFVQSILRNRVTGVEETIQQRTMGLTASFAVGWTRSLSGLGSWEVIIRGQDAYGRVAESVRRVDIIEAVQTKVTSPSIVLDDNGDGSGTATLTCSTAGSAIQYSITAPGASSPGSFSTYTTPVTQTGSFRIWAKATKSGLTDSDTVSDAIAPVPPGGGGFYAP